MKVLTSLLVALAIVFATISCEKEEIIVPNYDNITKTNFIAEEKIRQQNETSNADDTSD